MTAGMVRFWFDDEGYGVIDSPDTPGGCWTHFSAVAIDGHRTLQPGQLVNLQWEVAEQDGYVYRAVTARPVSSQPPE